LPPSPPEHPTPPDVRGMLLIGASLTLFMTGIECAGRGVLPAFGAPVCVMAGVLMFWAAVRHCRAAANPAVDFSLLAIPTFHAATIAGSLFRAGAGALPFLVPLTLQTGFGYSASASGLVTFASALGSFCMRPMTSLALRRFSVRTVLCAGSVSFAAVLTACSFMSKEWAASGIFLLLLVGGLSRSLSFATLGALAFADVPRTQLAAATSFQGTAQQLMKAVGVTVAAGTIQVTMLVSPGSHTERWQLACAFVVIAFVVLGSCPMFLRLPAQAGEGISAARRGG